MELEISKDIDRDNSLPHDFTDYQSENLQNNFKGAPILRREID